MKDLDRRLTRLETRQAGDDDRLEWAEVHAAAQRHQARVRLQMCRRLGVEASDSRVMGAAAQLVDDSPEQRTQDAETLQRWREQQGIPPDPGEVRQRIAQRLETVAERLAGEPR